MLKYILETFGNRANRDVIDTGSIHAGRDVVIQTTGDHSRSESAREKNEGRRDEFRPSFYLPPNPREVLLDFGLSPGNAESTTPEAKVMREILREGGNEQKTRIVSIYGKAGVGKSCILRGIGDEDFQEKFKLREHFPGGIYFLSLGMDATESTLIQGLAEIIKMCGGEKLGEELRNEDNLHIVLKKVKDWMKDKKCLVLLDDCWERNGLGGAKVLELAQVLSNNSGSVLVMTTRFKDLARLGSTIRVEERQTDSEEAKAILLKHANVEREEIEDEEAEAFHKVLNMCGGLPLFLSVVGRGVAELAMELEREESGRKAVWMQYWEMLQALGQDGLMDTQKDEYPNLSKTLRLSLELLSERRGSRLESLSISKLTFQDMHRALCVFKKQAKIPISVCRRLWKARSDGAALQIGEWFAGVGLADMERRRLGEKHVMYIRMHDLVHMFAVECAETKREVSKWHGQLLAGYLPKEGGNEVVREWWNVCKNVGGDGYLFENVCRHLVSSGNMKEVEGLLLSGEWTKLRFEVGGLSAWKADFWERFEGKKENGDGESEMGIERGLEMVRDAVAESWAYVHANPRELGYQVVGRLVDCENGVVQEYLRSIEKLQCKPWLRPMQRCWERPGKGMMIGEFHLGSNVEDIALHKKSCTAALGVDWEVVILDLQEMRVTARCVGHTGLVRKLGINNDGKRVFSWSDDGTIRQWEIETGEEHKDGCIQPYDEERDGSNRTRCAAFSPENSLVVTGSSWGKIKVWDLRTGERVGRTMGASKRIDHIELSPDGRIAAAGLRTGSVLLCDLQKGRPVCGELKGNKHVTWIKRGPLRGLMTSCAFSASGRLVASCAEDTPIRLWNVESKPQLGEPLKQFEEESDHAFRVAFTEDSKQILSAHVDGSISVWNVENGAEIRSWQAHARGITCVGLTGDLGSRLAVSGGRDGTVRVWDLQTTPKEENERICHKDSVSCLAASPDGSLFVSGSWDETLRMWDGCDGSPIGEALRGHQLAVTSVAVSPNSRQVVSGSDDSTVRVWDVGRRAQVGDALRGHADWIRCVAYSPNGEFIFSGSDDKTLRVWRAIDDCEDGEDVGKLASRGVSAAEPSNDEELPNQGTLRLEKTLQHDEAVTSVAVSRDGQRVVSGLENGAIWVWDMKSGSCLDRKQSENRYSIERIEFSETNWAVATNWFNQQLQWLFDRSGYEITPIEISQTNGVVTTYTLNEELRWYRNNERGLTGILHREDETGIARAESQEGYVTNEFCEVVCKGRVVQLKSNGQKIATLPEDVFSTVWMYNAKRRVLCVGHDDGQVLFFQVEC